MKKIFMFFIGLMMSTMAFAADVVIVDDVRTYTGSEPFIYSKSDGKVYAYNSLNEYEVYGQYTKVTDLKVASGSDQAIDFIETVPGMPAWPYINSGYTHTEETRVVVECSINDSPEGDGAYDWQAVFGARGGITNQAFMFFNRQGGNDRGGYVVGTKEQWGEDGNNIPHNSRIVIDCQGHEAKIYYASDYPNGTPVITIYNDSNPAAGNCPLMIFTNNNNQTRVGSDTHYGSAAALMKLYNFKIFEGEETTPVAEYVPYVFTTGDAGLKEVNTGKRYHAEEGSFEVPEGTDLDVLGGIAVYVGKRVNLTTDNHEYKWDGEKWVDLGEMSTKEYELPEGATNYKNMMNWTCPEGKYICFGIPHGDNTEYWGDDGSWGSSENNRTAYYDEANDMNVFPHYIGTGMHEPIGCWVPVEEGNAYRYSFDFGCSDWDCTWTGTTMHAGVLNDADLTNNNFTETCTTVGGRVLANYKLPTSKTVDNENNIVASEHVVMEFIADKEQVCLFFPFGYVSDDRDFQFMFGHFLLEEFIYPDLYNEVNIYRPQLQVLIETVKEFEGNTTDKLQNDLNAALAEAEKAFAADDEAGHRAAIKMLQAAYDAANAVNIGTLRKTVAIAEEEGITENIAEAKEFFVDGTDVTVANTLLNNLRIARKVLHAEKHVNKFAGNEPGLGDFYFYNVGQQRFLCGGDDWGAHAALGYPGIVITIINNGEYEDGEMTTVLDGYVFDTHLPNGYNEELQISLEYLNYGGYMDTAGRDPWTFIPVEGKPGVYNIARLDATNDEGNPVLLGYRPGTYARVDTDLDGVDNPDNQWILVTEKDRRALLADATPENPVDASWLIHAPGFNQREDVSLWVNDANGPNTGIWGRGDNYIDFVYECWNGGNNNNEMYLWQEIEVPEDGWYILAVQGYYRDGSIANQLKVIEEGGDLIKVPVLYAYDKGNEQVMVELVNIFDEKHINKAPGYAYTTKYGEVPNSCVQAYNTFENGAYWNAMKVELEKGIVMFGVDKVSETLEDWTVLDNFRFVYTKTEPTDQQVDGVDGIVTKNENEPVKIYNLQGMQVKSTKLNGIYIVNGKKVIMK